MLLGVATASTQIEGGIDNNNWYDWSKNGDKTKDFTSCIKACRHYENYVEDTKLMKSMGIETYRLSLEWSRIEPEEGKFDEEAVNHYKDEINLLIQNGIVPLVTLHHFSNPIWFEKQGGFLNAKSPETFNRYVEYVAKEFKGLMHEYCTINEPNVYAVNCYMFGEWINEEKSLGKTLKCLKNFCKAHILAYKTIKEIDPKAKVGFALHIQNFKPKSKHNPFYRFETWVFDRCFNTCAMTAMKTGKYILPLGFIGRKKGDYADFIGINYYQTIIVAHFAYKPDPSKPVNDLGWALEPDGIRTVCEKYHKKYGDCPIYITENGTADRKDDFRSQYIYDHLDRIKDLDYVERYYYWTFMDNWEWKEGMTARFGLISYDIDTEEKVIRDSGHFYTSIIQNKGVTQEAIDQYLNKSEKEAI